MDKPTSASEMADAKDLPAWFRILLEDRGGHERIKSRVNRALDNVFAVCPDVTDGLDDDDFIESIALFACGIAMIQAGVKHMMDEERRGVAARIGAGLAARFIKAQFGDEDATIHRFPVKVEGGYGVC